MIFLIDLYHKIIVSAIDTTSKGKLSSDVWRYSTLMVVSLSMTLNIVSVWLIIDTHFYPGFTSSMKLEIVQVNQYNIFFNFIIYLFAPIFILNGFYIFWKQRYLKLMAKYPFAHNKKISGIYFVASWCVFFGYWIYIMASRG
jgi:hypothetical protein